MLGQYRILYKQQLLFDGFLLTRCDALRGKAHQNLPAWFVFGVQSSATTTLGMPFFGPGQSAHAQYHEASHPNLTEMLHFSGGDALLRCHTPTVRSKELCNEINVFMSDGFRLVCIPPFTQAGRIETQTTKGYQPPECACKRRHGCLLSLISTTNVCVDCA